MKLPDSLGGCQILLQLCPLIGDGKVRSLYRDDDPKLLNLAPEPGLGDGGAPTIDKGMVGYSKARLDLYISQLVIDEASAGDPQWAAERMEILKNISSLEDKHETGELAFRILDSGILPAKAAIDAAHIATAAVHGIDFLLTWNCKHIANAAIIKSVEAICRQAGFECPVICTPMELF